MISEKQKVSDVDYIDPEMDVIDETKVVLMAGWKMNKASGVIHKELGIRIRWYGKITRR